MDLSNRLQDTMLCKRRFLSKVATSAIFQSPLFLKDACSLQFVLHLLWQRFFVETFHELTHAQLLLCGSYGRHDIPFQGDLKIQFHVNEIGESHQHLTCLLPPTLRLDSGLVCIRKSDHHAIFGCHNHCGRQDQYNTRQ